jgi:hypothetical protein
MHSMASEPARLQAEQHRIRRELAAAAVEQYPVLVDAAERAGVVADCAARAVKHADQCAGTLARLRSESVTLQTLGTEWRGKKQLVGAAVANSAKLAELLDAPASLEACVRSDMYHEARLVIEHVRNLAEALPQSRTVAQVAKQVEQTLDTLLASTVLPRLRGNLSVTVALKITTFLRQLGVDQAELRTAFLAMRAEYVNAFVAELEHADSAAPATLLKRLLVHWKLVVAEAIATFNSCFPESEESMVQITTWGLERAIQLHDLWRRYLPGVSVGVDLADLAAEVSQCSVNWAKCGIDISTLLLDSIVELCLE